MHMQVGLSQLELERMRGLVDQIRTEQGHIDVLVNEHLGAEKFKGGPADWNKPIWQNDLGKGLRILQLAIDTHLITSHYLVPLLIDRPGGLLVEVTEGTTDYNAWRYRLSVFYDLAKMGVNRLAFSQGHELRPYGATAVAITPLWLRSEMMLDNFGVTESTWRTALDPARARFGQPVAAADSGRGPGTGAVEPVLRHLWSTRPRRWIHGPRPPMAGQLAVHP